MKWIIAIALVAVMAVAMEKAGWFDSWNIERNRVNALRATAPPKPDPMTLLTTMINMQGAACGSVTGARFTPQGNIIGECSNGMRYAAVQSTTSEGKPGWQLKVDK
jgi:hypothetical protein